MKKNKGFTLIELLVVIAIIALLLSITMPALKKAKEKTKSLMCRTNLRALSLSLRLYAEDNEDKLFSYLGDLYINQLAGGIDDLDKVRYCPSTRIDEDRINTRGNAKISWRWNFAGVDEYGSYGFNGWLYSYSAEVLAQSNGPIDWVGKAEIEVYTYPSLIKVKNPASVPVFFDANWVDAWPKDAHPAPVGSGFTTGNRDGDVVPDTLDLFDGGNGVDGPVRQHIQRLMLDRHFGICNVSFADCHVDNVKLEKLWLPKWHRKFQPYFENRRRENGKKIY
jgi:prepilin-type N-terminal cleavage/methylation domain-containing protein